MRVRETTAEGDSGKSCTLEESTAVQYIFNPLVMVILDVAIYNNLQQLTTPQRISITNGSCPSLASGVVCTVTTVTNLRQPKKAPIHVQLSELWWVEG